MVCVVDVYKLKAALLFRELAINKVRKMTRLFFLWASLPAFLGRQGKFFRHSPATAKKFNDAKRKKKPSDA